MPAGPIRTLIVDDEKPAQARLQALLRQRPEVDVVGIGSDGREAVTLIQDLRPDLVFLDIDMPHLDGFQVLGALGDGPLPATVFVTAYDRFAVAAFDAHAVDYLLKPFSDERFDSALDHALSTIRQTSAGDTHLQIEGVLEEHAATDQRSGFLERIVIRANNRLVLVNVRDVDWISAAGVYLDIHVGPTIHLYRSSLTALLRRLDPRTFVRVHRSAAVNADRIVELRPRGHGDYAVVLRGGREVSLSRAYRSKFEHWLGQTL